MSYDLYFYKRSASPLSEDDIAAYLNNKLVASLPYSQQWFFKNSDTDVYYSFERNKPEDDPEAPDLFDNFTGFENTWFSFSLDFLRPAFFGLEAFLFIEAFLNDLDLYVVNPQDDFELPVRPSRLTLFESWNATNLWGSAAQFNDLQGTYFAPDRSNIAWEYNFKRKLFQQRLGEEYVVPRIHFLRTKDCNQVVTLCAWTQHTANLFLPADYYLLIREYRKFFRIVQDTVLLDKETFTLAFGSYFGEFNFEGCKLIHPLHAHKVRKKFNTITSALRLEDFAERIPVENLFNALPGR